jgi:hypothetical protein
LEGFYMDDGGTHNKCGLKSISCNPLFFRPFVVNPYVFS